MFSKERIDALRASAGRWEHDGVLDAAALDAIYESRLCKLFVPEEYGGRLVSLPEAVRIFVEASRIEGSFGWAVTIGSGGGYFASCLEPEAAAAIYADPRAVIAGSGAPTGRAVRTEGGYSVSGSWKYCSGSTYATTFTAVATVAAAEAAEANGDGGAPQALAFALRPDQVEIVPDWRAFGLKATASHTIVAKDAFVPDSRVFQVDRNDRRSEAIYRVPFLALAESSFAAVALGIARHLLEEASSLADAGREAWSKGGAARYESVAGRIRQASERLEAQAGRYYEAVDRAWERLLEGEADDADWAAVGRESKRAASTSLRTGQSVFPFLGIGSVMEDAPVNRIWRDLQTACQHTLIVDFASPASES